MSSFDEKILLDENKQYRFDFSNAEYVIDMHELANIKDAVNPKAMLEKIKHEKFYTGIAKKYYDSLMLFWAMGKNNDNLPINYILLIEHPEIDKKIRRQLKMKIIKRLPINIGDSRIKREFLSTFDICDLEEWSNNSINIKIEPVV